MAKFLTKDKKKWGEVESNAIEFIVNPNFKNLFILFKNHPSPSETEFW